MKPGSRGEGASHSAAVPSFELTMGVLLFGAIVVRVAYVLAQPLTDPSATGAILDGAYYISWGRALAEGTGTPGGAFYLAPLYAWLLAGFFKLFGDSIAWLYLLQHLLVVLTALLLALCGRRLAGPGAGVAAAALLLLYHPALYFASRPIGEPVSLFLLVLALWLLQRPEPRSAAAAGIVLGLSALGRPSLLLVVGLWFVIGMVGLSVRDAVPNGPRIRRRARFALAVTGAGLVLAPVTVRNWLASGHLVPISSNAGITSYHGNGPGAQGIGVFPAGFSGSLATQREEATRIASARSGRRLDDVEADRWWGRQARNTRLADPGGTLRLLLRRAALTASSTELALDYAPGIDRNPWRRAAPLPFGVLLALAVVGVALAGFRRSGGWPVWSAITACVATPLLFYVSSRYRLPTAVLLCLPAGVGLAALLRAGGRRRLAVLAAGVLVAVGSMALPSGGLARTTRAGALANRGVMWKQLGDLGRAEEDMREALATDPDSIAALFDLGVVATQLGRTVEAERLYTRALEIQPSHVASAHNLSNLMIRTGRPEEAVAVLQRALVFRPDHAGCWTNLVVAFHDAGRDAEARDAAASAARSGVTIPARLLESLQERPGA